MKNSTQKELKASSNLNRRVTTGTLFVISMLIGVFGGGLTFFLLFLVINLLCMWEFLGLALPQKSVNDQFRMGIGLLLGVTPLFYTMLLQSQWFVVPDLDMPPILLLTPLIFGIFILELFLNTPRPFASISHILLGTIYIGLPLSLLPFIAFENGYYVSRFLIALLLMIWLNDTGAYFVGKKHGKTPLFKRISPKKTWEGTLGGLVTVLLLCFILSAFIDDLALWQWLVLGFVTFLFGSLGDLVESMFKRSLEVKDSGTLLPGHGGFLDRFDGFLFAIPFFVLLLHILR